MRHYDIISEYLHEDGEYFRLRGEAESDSFALKLALILIELGDH